MIRSYLLWLKRSKLKIIFNTKVFRMLLKGSAAISNAKKGATHLIIVSAGKDIFWYAREKQDGVEQAVQDELSLVKAREEELMMEVIVT